MTSYLVYALARFHLYNGLTTQGVFGRDVIYEAYPQLHLEGASYRRVNDTFNMYITRLLQSVEHVRISNSTEHLNQKCGEWFIQFPTFSYIRIYGFQRDPYRLPRYLMNHLILLEVTKQICDFYAILKKDKHKTRFGNEFPLRIGGNEACPSLISTCSSKE
jgi:hypothetical protein